MIETLVLGGLAAWAVLTSQRARTQALDATDDDVMTMYAPGVYTLAAAIARAEGFGVVGALPTICHNPGDLADPSGTLFYLPTRGPEAIVMFPDDAAGWDALYRQLQRIADGRSTVYARSMTIAQMAEHYAPKPNPAEWAANVAAFAGFTPDTTLETVFG